MTDFSELQKRCQRGAANLNDANNLLAECYAALGLLQKDTNRYQHIKSTWHDGGLIERLAANVLPEDWDAAIDADMGKED